LCTVRARARDVEVVEEPPPRRMREPNRSGGPRTERDVANDVVFGVVAVDLLFRHDRLDMEVGCSFQRAVYDAVLGRLRKYADSTTSEARAPAKSWRLQDRVLERQFSLSPPYTLQAAADLRMAHPDLPFYGEAQRSSRAILRDHKVEAADDPVSSALIAWIAYAVSVGGEAVRGSTSRTRAIGYGEKVPVSEWLLPVFVEHDRSPHAERMAMLFLGEEIKSRGGKLHPDAKIKGGVCVYASHTPCISCLACFCQFRRKLPGVNLWVCFDDWHDTRRWFDDGSAVAAAEAAAAGQDFDDDADVGGLFGG